MSEFIEVEKIVRESRKAFLCENAQGVQAWIKKASLGDNGMVKVKVWEKAVAWSENAKAYARRNWRK